MEKGKKRKRRMNEWVTRLLNEKCRAFTNNGHAVIWCCEAVVMNISFSHESHADGGYLSLHMIIFHRPNPFPPGQSVGCRADRTGD